MSGSLNNAKRNNGDLAGADLMVYFTHDNQAEFNGIAFVGKACSLSGTQININEKGRTIFADARTLAHELGQNIGMQ